MKPNNARPKPLSPADETLAYDAAQCVVQTHHTLAQKVRGGMTLAEIDILVAEILSSHGVRSCFLGYRPPRMTPFPSHACLSLNHCIVHGHAKYETRPIEEGDVLKIDIGVTRKGWIGDAGWTYVVGEPKPEIRNLMESGKTAIRRGIDQMQIGARLIEWAKAVQRCAEDEYGMHLVRGFGGHGIGRSLHGSPFISNTVPVYPGEWPDANLTWKPGMIVAVEPMVALGTGETQNEARSWPVYTADGSFAVHYEHDVLITTDGPRVLTEGLDEVNDVLPV